MLSSKKMLECALKYHRRLQNEINLDFNSVILPGTHALLRAQTVKGAAFKAELYNEEQIELFIKLAIAYLRKLSNKAIGLNTLYLEMKKDYSDKVAHFPTKESCGVGKITQYFDWYQDIFEISPDKRIKLRDDYQIQMT